MTKRDFFILVIKLFGLFSLVTSLFSVFPNNISFALMYIDAFSLAWLAVAVFVVIGLFVLLVLRPDKVVSLLRLDKGFDDDRIDLGNLKSSDILKLGIFIIGGLLMLDNIPPFLSHTLFAFKGDVSGKVYDTEDKFRWALNAINLLLGYLLVTNYSSVSKLLKRDKEKNV